MMNSKPFNRLNLGSTQPKYQILFHKICTPQDFNKKNFGFFRSALLQILSDPTILRNFLLADPGNFYLSNCIFTICPSADIKDV